MIVQFRFLFSLYLFLSLFVSISLFFSLSFSFPSNFLFLSPFLSISPSPFFFLRSFPSLCLSLSPPLILLLIYNSCCVLKNLWFYCKVRILSITRNKDKFWRRMVFFKYNKLFFLQNMETTAALSVAVLYFIFLGIY